MVAVTHTRHRINRLLLYSSFLCVLLLTHRAANAQSHQWIADTTVALIDGNNALYSHVQPGDTIFLQAGNRNKLLIRNFTGAAGSPVIFMNKDGVVSISTNDYYGVSILNCRYVRFTGTGQQNELYGIQIKKVAAGCGIGAGAMSSDVEIDHVSIENCSTEGIFAKTDPDCNSMVTRERFTQFNTSIHHNYICNVGNEGMYIGSSYYAGIKLTCNGKDTLVLPPILDGVSIYDNIVKDAGWDGIQLSSAPLHCRIFNNTVLNDSRAAVPNQMSGIIMGGGSSCNCYNNRISNGKGDGIENHGLGGNRIFNNVIENAGLSYLPNDATQMKHGIFVSDVSMAQGASVQILFNDIIHPKSDGIRFQSTRSKHNLIASNCIIHPGNFNLYEYDNTPFSGNDAYVMLPLAGTDVQVKNNFFAATAAAAGISPVDYSVLPGSPLINRGHAGDSTVWFDYKNNRRPVGGLYDIGAVEYDGGADTLLHTFQPKPLLFPNPAHTVVNIRYLTIVLTRLICRVYTVNGTLLQQHYYQPLLPGLQQFAVPVTNLPRGIYVYSIEFDNIISYGKLLKL